MPRSVVETLRQPEYVGENRCFPCTIANTLIAFGVATGMGYATGAVLSPAIGLATATGVLGISLGAIWLRGYLLPYTPSLTTRYLPDTILRWFDKGTEPASGLAEIPNPDDPSSDTAPLAGGESDLDPEPVLVAAGVIEPCADEADLCPTDEFTTAWQAEMAALNGDAALAERVATAVGVEQVTIEEQPESVLIQSDDRAVTRWESRAALVADMAALPLLAERVEQWTELDRRQRGSLLSGTRVFLESCPACGGPVEFSQETVESCCRSINVIAMVCGDCGTRLLEVDAD